MLMFSAIAAWLVGLVPKLVTGQLFRAIEWRPVILGALGIAAVLLLLVTINPFRSRHVMTVAECDGHIATANASMLKRQADKDRGALAISNRMREALEAELKHEREKARRVMAAAASNTCLPDAAIREYNRGLAP